MLRFTAPTLVLLLVALCGCPAKEKDKPVAPEPVTEPAPPIETPKPAIEVPDPAKQVAEPAETMSQCDLDLAAAQKRRYTVEDESQFLRASVAAKHRGELPAMPALPDEPYATASCEDKLKHAEKVSEILTAFRDQLKTQANSSNGANND